MLIDHYPVEDVFARVPEVAAQTDPVLKELDRLLSDDQLYQQVRADLGKRSRFTLVHGRHSTPVEVILRMLIEPRISTNGVIEKPKSASRTAWCCAGSAACILSGSPMRRRCFAGCTRCVPKRCMRSMTAWSNWPGKRR